jgi:hypothetical protein
VGDESSSRGAEHEVWVEGQIHPWHKDTISVPEIRELGGFPADSPVVAVDPVEEKEWVLPEDAVHDVPPLEPGKPLVKRMGFKRGPVEPERQSR